MSSWAGYSNQYMQLLPKQSSEHIAPLKQMFGVTDNNNNAMMQQLLQQMQTMQQQISGINLTNQQQNQFGGKYNTTNQGGNNKNVNPRTGLPWKRYCWLCGCCTHWSKNCAQKKSGHKDEASFKTRMGGSNENCK